MHHDFKTAVVELRGVTKTEITELPYGAKNIDVMGRLFAESIEKGRLDPHLPTFRDSAIASEYAWKFFMDTKNHDLPAIGNLETLDEILQRRRTIKNGYGLLGQNKWADD